MNNVTIEQVSNGYIVTESTGIKFLCSNIKELFKRLLLGFEGRSEHLGGEYYAKVVIIVDKDVDKS